MPKYILPNGKAVFTDEPVLAEEMDKFISSFMDSPEEEVPNQSEIIANATRPINDVTQNVQEPIAEELTPKPSIIDRVKDFIGTGSGHDIGQQPSIIEQSFGDKPLLPEIRQPETWMGGFGKGIYDEFVRPFSTPQVLAEQAVLSMLGGGKFTKESKVKESKVKEPRISPGLEEQYRAAATDPRNLGEGTIKDTIPENIFENKNPVRQTLDDAKKSNLADELEPNPFEGAISANKHTLSPSNEVIAQPDALIKPAGTPKPEIANIGGTQLETSPVQRVQTALAESKPLNKKQAEIYTKERGERIAKVASVETPGRSGYYERLGHLKGEHTKVQFEPLADKLGPIEIDSLHDAIASNTKLDEFSKIAAENGLESILSGNVPPPSQVQLLKAVFGEGFTQPFETGHLSLLRDQPSILQKWYDLRRGMMSVDPPFITSAAFRQASSFVGTKRWFKAWGEAVKAYGDKAVADELSNKIMQRRLFRPATDIKTGKLIPSYAERSGLRIGELSKYSARDEAIRGQLAEKVPLYGRHVAGSNRAFNAFLNSVSADTFESMINDAAKLGLDPRRNIHVGKEIAGFVNTTLKRGQLGAEFGKHSLNLERHSKLLSNLLFSPRSVSSEIRMLNPSTYINASPLVRKAYTEALVRRVGTWWTMAGLAQLGGASVSKDPTNPDFGKIRIGDTRIDPPGGLQQYLVLGAKLGKGGSTSSTSGQFRPFGKGYKPETRASTIGRFSINRTHPTLKMAIDLLSATERTPFHVTDNILQSAAPMFADDLMEVAKSNPDLAPLILGTALMSGAGMGTQSYTRGEFGKPIYWPEEMDINIGAK